MSSSDPPTDRDDELASASLDGQLDAAEREALADDPTLRARAEELRAAAEAIGTFPAPPSAEDRSALLDRALAAATTATVVPLARLQSRRSRLPSLTTAAAALLVVALAGLTLFGLGRVLSGGGESGDDAASSAGDAEPSAEAEGGESGAGGKFEAAPSTTANSADAPDALTRALAAPLGDFASDDELRAALGRLDLDRLAGDQSGPASAADEAGRCASAVQSQLPEPGALVAAAAATIDGEGVLVYRHRVGEGDQLSVADATTCVIRFAVQR